MKTKKRVGVVMGLLALFTVTLCVAGSVIMAQAATEEPQEEYVWIACLATLPLFVTHDYPALRQEAERLGVQITFAGPADMNIELENNILEQTIARKPAGIIFMPFSPSSAPIINKALDQGIPIVCVDGDCPGSNRLAFIGTGWYDLGATQAKIMGRMLNGKGKVMLSAVIPNNNTDLAVAGYKDYMAKHHPDIEILGVNNDEGDIAKAAQLARETIVAYPDIAGFSGIDASSGPGIATAVKEAGRVGDIKITCVDDTPDILQAVQEEVIQATVVQKREAFETWALRVVYSYNHPGYSIGEAFKDVGFNMIPNFITTGTMVVTKDNLDALKEAHEFEKQFVK